MAKKTDYTKTHPPFVQVVDRKVVHDYSPLEIRRVALDLAVATHARDLVLSTDAEREAGDRALRTAKAYEQYICDGTVPAAPELTTEEVSA